MKLSEISNLVGGLLKGDGDVEITGVGPLESASRGEIAFLTHSRYHHLLGETHASALLLPEGEWQLNVPHVLCKNPYLAFAMVMQKFHSSVAENVQSGVHPTAVLGEGVILGHKTSVGANVTIDAGVRIGDRTVIWAGCFVGHRSTIGDDVVIYPNVSIRELTEIGNHVIIHSGTVIGSDGFGFAEEEGKFHKIPQIGRVIIEDQVEIGANCCIDRATLGETRIHLGAKLDNLVHIAHNAEIGEHTALAAQCGISGSSKIGNYVRFGGQAGMAGHITIGDHIICGGRAGVTKSFLDRMVLSGFPARNHREQLKIEASQNRLPDLIKRIASLEKIIESIIGTESPDETGSRNEKP